MDQATPKQHLKIIANDGEFINYLKINSWKIKQNWGWVEKKGVAYKKSV